NFLKDSHDNRYSNWLPARVFFKNVLKKSRGKCFKVEVGVRVLVSPRPEHLPELVRSFGHHYQGIICLKMILATCSSLIAGYAINELLSHPEAFRRDLLAQLAMKASEFYLVVDDVSIIKAKVTPNLYGNLVSNVAAGIAGGTGVMPGGNVGPEHAVFEQGASAGNVGKLELVEQKKANPVALLLSSAMMLRHLQFPSFADRLETAVQHVIEEGKYRTKDLGGNSTTQQVVDAVLANLD
uniref:Isopropylmalate dehydrogenase-like domain-containing protein n=1 Tax=Chenopodium quinoa TaxID=63459 RepID=A0A803MCD5_CHEQI